MGGKKKNNNDTTVEIVVELIKSYFTNYSDVLEAANAMVEEYGDDAPEKAIGYTPVFFGANFVSVDKARKRKYSLYAEERVSALAYAAFRSLVEYTGSTRCKIADLMEKAHSIEYVADPKGDKTAPLLIGAALAKKWRKINTDDGLYVSDAYLSEAEESIARSIFKLVKRSGTEVSSDDLRAIGEKTDVKYDEVQKSAIVTCLKSGISILTGGPGTGKTTTLKAIVNATQLPENRFERVICMAPTNTAAERLRGATGVTASTIHSTLGLIPCIKLKCEKDIPANSLVIVDEFSMVDSTLADTLLAAVVKSEGTSLLIVGDEDQLESVGPGAVLRDLIESELIPVVRLKHIYRQDDDVIIENAQKIRNGDATLKENKNFHTEFCSLEDEMLRKIIAYHARITERSVNLSPLEIRILCPLKSKKYSCSVRTINDHLHTYYHKEDISINGISVGEPVVFTANRKDLGIYNGDLGIVQSLGEAFVIDFQGKIVTLDKKAEKCIELAYATTVHKAQGGEVKCVIIALPDEEEHMLTRRLLYVAVTRAKTRCIIVYQNEALRNAIGDLGGSRRITGLDDAIKKEAGR